jgi:hypothetical protein
VVPPKAKRVDVNAVAVETTASFEHQVMNPPDDQVTTGSHRLGNDTYESLPGTEIRRRATDWQLDPAPTGETI